MIVNAQRSPVRSFHRENRMMVNVNAGSIPGYEQNSCGEWQEQPEYKEPRSFPNGDAWNRNFRKDDDDHDTQPCKILRPMDIVWRKALFGDIAHVRWGRTQREIKLWHISDCHKADPSYWCGIADALGIPSEETM